MGNKTVNRSNIVAMAWRGYQIFIERLILGSNCDAEHISWQDHIFSNLIVYLLPICCIALIPGVYVGLKTGYVFIAVFDLGVVLCIAMVSLSKRLHILVKKIFIMGVLYSLAIVLIINLGFMGPGYIYLLALSVLATLIFSTSSAYISVVTNFLICACFAVIVYNHAFDIKVIHEYSLGAYIAVSSNLIFLSWLCVLLIGNTVNGLENNVKNSILLKGKLKTENAKRLGSIQRLKESNAYYKSLFTLNPSPIWVLDYQTGKFLQVNDAAVKNYGYTKKEFLSMTINDIKLEEDTAKVDQHIKENELAGIPVRLTTQHRRKNGELFPTEVIFNTIQTNGKKAILVMAMDITEQMIYTTAIENQNNKLRDIAHIQSHKVRGPLATIMGLAQLFEENLPGIQTKDLIAGIISSSKKLDNVIREIVDKTSAIDY